MRQSITTRRLTKVMLALPIFLTDANNENKVKVLRFVTSPDDQDIDHQDTEGRDGQERAQFTAQNKVDFLRRQMKTQRIFNCCKSYFIRVFSCERNRRQWSVRE